MFMICAAVPSRKAEDERRVEELEVARAELEERLRQSEARRAKLEQRVAALGKQNAALAKGGQATTKEGLDAVKAQLKGYSKGMEVGAPHLPIYPTAYKDIHAPCGRGRQAASEESCLCRQEAIPLHSTSCNFLLWEDRGLVKMAWHLQSMARVQEDSRQAGVCQRASSRCVSP